MRCRRSTTTAATAPCKPRPPLRRLVRDRRATTRHLLPAELPGRDAQAPATSSSSRRRPPPSSAATGPASGAGPTPRPGSPEWNVRGDVVARAMRLVVDGVVDREGVGGLARRLSYSERHLTRLVTDELGAGPLAIARAQRAQHRPHAHRDDRPRLHGRRLRRRLRQRAPVQRHRPRRVRGDAVGAARRRRHATGRRRPASSSSTSPCASRSTPTRARWRSSPPAPCRASRRWDGDGVPPRARPPPRARRGTVRRLPSPSAGRRPAVTAAPAARRLARPRARPCGASAGCSTSTPIRSPSTPRSADDPGAGAVRRRRPRACACPGSVDPFETAVRAVVGQQISVAGARTVAGRIVAAAGAAAVDRRRPADPRVPDARRARRRRPGVRCRCRAAARRTIVELAARVADGRLVLDAGADRADVAAALLGRARHRSVDGRLRADARARRPRRVPAHRPRRARRPGPARPRRPIGPSAGGRGARTPCTTCGRSPGPTPRRTPMTRRAPHDRQPDRTADADRRATARCARSASRTPRPSPPRPDRRPGRPGARRRRAPARRVLRRRPA